MYYIWQVPYLLGLQHIVKLKGCEGMKKVFTRIGISPFSTEQHIGIYRSFLVNIFVSKFYDGETFLRIDDTNPRHLANVHDLIDDVSLVVDADLISSTKTSDVAFLGKNRIPAIFESGRTKIYQKYLNSLANTGLLLDTNGAIYFDVNKYIEIYGDEIIAPFQGRSNRRCVISRILPRLSFPLLVDNYRRFLWHFTSVVDDYELGITHIVRANDKIDNQVPQMMLNNALDFCQPIYMYTKIMNSDPFPVTIRDLHSVGISDRAIRSYLYGSITGRGEKKYDSFEDAVKDFSPSSITPGQFFFDIKKLASIQKRFR